MLASVLASMMASVFEFWLLFFFPWGVRFLYALLCFPLWFFCMLSVPFSPFLFIFVLMFYSMFYSIFDSAFDSTFDSIFYSMFYSAVAYIYIYIYILTIVLEHYYDAFVLLVMYCGCDHYTAAA